MSKFKDFDLPTFQSKVLHEYKDLKWVRDVAEDVNTIESGGQRDKYFDLVGRGFFQKMMVKFARKSLRDFLKRPENDIYSRKSKEITFHSRTKELLCADLKKIQRINLLDEEFEIEVIKVVTKNLTDKTFVETFPIDFDPRLFAYIVDDILRRGFKGYC